MDSNILDGVLEIEARLRNLRRRLQKDRLSQTEAMLIHGKLPMLPLVLLASDGSSVSVLVRERIDTSALELRSYELRLTTTGAPQPAKGDSCPSARR